MLQTWIINWTNVSNQLDSRVQILGLTCPTYPYNSKLNRHPLVDIQTNIVFTS
ncbi:hypothetical protein HMPREF1173_02569 [Prevotella nigrescens CC14M]|uniref:Uncharacterized protein n=2 Tax=Prevotella TaxID=838 RepID=V8C8C9_9BACT|nr:hypothetical protein HMPREF1173_02569 [Prevotella nigrescens CC14M]SUB87147.1 Uncharacterised protein [Prevotella denticola]SUB94265.1 Uncharacterised protein [Prevotella denticola]